jgi:methyl-accepting chemotaxis protein
LGSAVVGQAGSTMREIVEAATRVSTMISDISLSATQQTEGLDEIGRSVEQLDGMTQQNAALVEQTAAAAASLKDNANRLTAAMEYFKLP